VLSPVLTINGRDFEQVCLRRSGVAVYHAPDAYLRIGAGIEVELATHRRMVEHGFPVAPLLDEGIHDGVPYFVEASLGSSTLGEAFDRECETFGRISESTFAAFNTVAARHARAQVATSTPDWSSVDFAELIGLESAAALVPDLAADLRVEWERVDDQLQGLPGTLLHFDLHPYNMCAGGVIDLEGVGWGPLGYDVVTASLTPPAVEVTSAEPVGSRFTTAQLDRHQQTLAEIFDVVGRPTDHLGALALCRGVAWCAQRHRDPAVQDARVRGLQAALSAYRSSHTPRD
jgi:Phosphotransferase enzyme family